MVYLKFKPSHLLEPFVECYFSWSSEGVQVENLSVESPPNGYCSIVFNLGDTYVLKNKKFDNLQVPLCFLSGQNIYTYQLLLNGRVNMVGIVFKPAALATMFDLPVYQYTEERISLHTIFDHTLVDIIYKELSEAGDVNFQMKILESFLLQQLTRTKPVCDHIDFVANKIIAEHGMLTVSDMMEGVFTSRRNFERQFFRKVGLSPKYYARISRMSYLMNSIAGKKHVEWKQLLNKCAFYDQSHFIRDFVEFTGRTPQKYLEDNQELANLVDKPRERRIDDR